MWILCGASAILIGLSRGGLKGIGPLFALLMAVGIGAKKAIGVIVPLLILADLLALVHYKGDIQKKNLKQFLPVVLLGLFLGAWIGKDLADVHFKHVLSILIVLGLVMMWIWESRSAQTKIAGKWWFVLLGMGAGLYSLLGNFAGAFATIYFLMTGMSKRELIGTATMVFFIVNLVKLPFHIWVWLTMSKESLQLDLYLFPAVILGFFVGIKIVDRIDETNYRRFLYVVTTLGVLLILIR